MSGEMSNVGVIGLAVMGSNLARNMARRGFRVSVYNRTDEVTRQFISDYGSEGEFHAAESLAEFVASLERPRRIVLMVKAGAAVDLVIEQLKDHLSNDDIIIDGGNSLYTDTMRRERELAEQGLRFLGVGISGGEEGALHGPSIMPGGSKQAWQSCMHIFEAISAKIDDGACTAYIGPDGAGHFVKMVHNGIEYADMQLLAEAYHVLSQLGSFNPAQLADIFEEWNKGPLASYLVEISAEVLRKQDDLTQGFLVDQILDSAGQKGTGRWTVQAALELGVALPGITAAVNARILSSLKSQRKQLAQKFLPASAQSNSVEGLSGMVESALYCSKLLAYTEGYALMQSASREYGWQLNLSEISRIWRGGCIIRAQILETLQRVLSGDSTEHLLFYDALASEIKNSIASLRAFCSLAAQSGLPVPAHANALCYFEMMSSERLPQNLTQAQRDYFGAHTYERLDRPGTFHTQWQAS